MSEFLEDWYYKCVHAQDAEDYLNLLKEARKGYVKLEDVKKIIKGRRDEPNSEWYLLDSILDEIEDLKSKN